MYTIKFASFKMSYVHHDTWLMFFLKNNECPSRFLTFFWFGGTLGSASRAKFPVSLSNHLGFTPRLLYSSTHQINVHNQILRQNQIKVA